jgi:HlyD family secretion protein
MAKKGSATRRLIKLFGIFIITFIVLGLFANAMGWLERGENAKIVEVEKAEIRTITQIVSASGKIQPETEVIIRPDVSGEVIELLVKEGDFVRQNDLLLRIKPDLYQARIDELNAALLTQRSRYEQARANKLQAEVEYMTQSQLYDRELVSELEYMQAKNRFEAEKANEMAAEYQIESAKAQLRRAQEELEQTVIRSPKDGTISSLAIERGERVLGQAQTAGTEMMRIARMEQMEVEVDVNENDIVNVSLGDTTRIEVDAYPDRIFEGVVTEIANSAEITGSGSAEQVTNYKVKVRMMSPHNLNMSPGELIEEQVSELSEDVFIANFKPGMSATVDIETETAYDVVTVPIQAVTVRDFIAMESSNSDSTENQSGRVSSGNTRNEDFRRVVFIVKDGIAKLREVSTGISDNRYMQIQGGLDEGEEVVTGSYRILSRELADGDPVEVRNQSSLMASN